MKPRNVGLLMVGAALAAGLAVKMTQPQPIPVVAAVVAPEVQPVNPPAEVSAPAPVVVTAPVPKPSPIPQPVGRAAAPEPVYNEPPKIAIRKNKPISIAAMKPTQWTPGRYEAPAPPVPAVEKPVVDKPAVEKPVVEKKDVDKKDVEKKDVPVLHQATLRTGLTIPIRLDESLSRDRSTAGGTFQASLAEPLVADGFVVAERGARVTGRIISTSRLELGLANLMTSDGQLVPLSTDGLMRIGDNVPSETVIRFRLNSRVTINERQTR